MPSRCCTPASDDERAAKHLNRNENKLNVPSSTFPFPTHRISSDAITLSSRYHFSSSRGIGSNKNLCNCSKASASRAACDSHLLTTSFKFIIKLIFHFPLTKTDKHMRDGREGKMFTIHTDQVFVAAFLAKLFYVCYLLLLLASFGQHAKQHFESFPA